MAHKIEEYTQFVSDKEMCELYKAARRLYGTRVVHTNSTYYGGGVAEILGALVPLMNDIGVTTGWRLLRGSPDFFDITKKFHNALQGDTINLTEIKKKIYVQTNVDFSTYNHIDHDCVIVHDPQPLPSVKFYRKTQPWIWRVHIDLSTPNPVLWDFLKHYVYKYDVLIVSSEKYKRGDLPLEQRVIQPAIDPLNAKNIDIDERIIKKYLKKFRIPTDKPIICQISRFDKWKDPEGVVQVFKIVKEKVDCRLVLCGSMATDDPDSYQTFEHLKRNTNDLTKDGDIILITSENNILVNALQRKAAVIVQKSLREGFGLTVTEALWKGKPVVASKVGGIQLQIKDGENGFLVKPDDVQGFADKVVEILKTPKLADALGSKGKQIVEKKYLITRLMKEYLDLIHELVHA